MKALVLLGLAQLILAAPVAGQSTDHSAHQGNGMSGMQMPAGLPPPADPHAGHQMDMDTAHDQADEGHSMPGMTPGTARATDPAAGPSGTDLKPGNAPPPSVAIDRAADRYFEPTAMADAQAALLGEHGGMTFHKITFNLAEYQAHKGRDGYRWNASAWFGGDINRFAMKSEGEGAFGEALNHGEIQALWSHALDPYWNLQAGVRQDFGTGPDRTYATVGIEGLAPYWFDVGASAFVSSKGDVLARLEGDIDQRITQALVLQPRVEANLALQDIPENGIGAGLSNLELGLRLRYEVRKEFAPYVGVSWERKFGDTARMAREAGDKPEATSFVAGIRFWF